MGMDLDTIQQLVDLGNQKREWEREFNERVRSVCRLE